MYIALRFKGYVKPEFREIFESIALKGEWEESTNEVFKKFGLEYDKAYLFSCNIIDPSQLYNKSTGYLSFEMDTINWDDEIDAFIEMIPYFIDNLINLQRHYEEDDYAYSYELIDEKCIITNYKSIWYL